MHEIAYVILGLGLSPHSSTIILLCHLHYTHTFISIYHPIDSPITAMPRSPQDGFKPKNAAVEKAFTSIINTSFKNPRKRCKYCKNGPVIVEEGEDEDLTMEDPEE